MRTAGFPRLTVEIRLLGFRIAAVGAFVLAARSLLLFDFFPRSPGSSLPDTSPVPRSVRSFWLRLGPELREQLQCRNSLAA